MVNGAVTVTISVIVTVVGSSNPSLPPVGTLLVIVGVLLVTEVVIVEVLLVTEVVIVGVLLVTEVAIVVAADFWPVADPNTVPSSPEIGFVVKAVRDLKLVTAAV